MEQKGRSHAGAGGREGVVWCRRATRNPKGAPGRASRKGRGAHLDPVQQFAHAPKAVGFYASQHVLRQIGHVKVLYILFCKTKGEESQRFSLKKMEKDKSSIFSGSLKAWREPAHVRPRSRGLSLPCPCQVGRRVPGRRLRISWQHWTGHFSHRVGWVQHLSLPLHFSFSLRKKDKKLQASCSMSYIQPPGMVWKNSFLSEIQWTNMLPLMGSEKNWDQEAPTGHFKKKKKDRIPPILTRQTQGLMPQKRVVSRKVVQTHESVRDLISPS